MGLDRHGRARRSDDDPRRRPPGGFRVRDRRRFAQLLDAAVGELPAPALKALDGAVFEVRDVPDAPGTDALEPAVRLAEAHAVGRRVRRLRVYRRPAELRAAGRDDLVDLLREAVLEAVAEALGVDPELWDEL